MRAIEVGHPEIELVVAHYAEDLRWIRRVPKEVRVTIYTKGSPFDGAVTLPNVGREAQTYLHHFLGRRDSLAPFTLCVQGHPFDHAHDLHRRLREWVAGSEKPQFEWLGFILDADDARGHRRFLGWSKNEDRHELDLEAFHRNLFGTLGPDIYPFRPGGQFFVAREHILSRPRSFWEKALHLSESFPDAAHCFERMWDRVFGFTSIDPELVRQGPVYLKPIRRLLDEG
jgi:hypothetical protein